MAIIRRIPATEAYKLMQLFFFPQNKVVDVDNLKVKLQVRPRDIVNRLIPVSSESDTIRADDMTEGVGVAK